MGNSPQRSAGLATKRAARASAKQQTAPTVAYDARAHEALAYITGRDQLSDGEVARRFGRRAGPP